MPSCVVTGSKWDMKCTADLRPGFDQQISIFAVKVQTGIPT
jgi:hypothetical protein